MALVVESNSTTAFAETSSLSITKPTGTVDGDLLLAIIAAEPGGGGTVNSVPTGWTLAKQETTDNATYVYYKTAATEGASWSWGFSASNVCGGGALRISGQDSDSPIDQTNSEKVVDDATPLFSTADIDPTNSNSLFVMVAHTSDTSPRTTSNYAIVTSNPSWTEHFDFNESTSSQNQSVAVATATRSQDTASGDISYTIDSGSAGADGRLIILNVNIEPDVSVTGTTGVINVIGNEGGVVGTATVTGDTGVINISGNEGVTTLEDSRVTNKDKNSASTIVNKDKN